MAPPKEALGPASRMVNSRASRACHRCRAKKIKCSVVRTGSPCHNCQSDEASCVVSESKRRKRFRLEDIMPRRSPAAATTFRNEKDVFAKIDAFLTEAPISLDFSLSQHMPRTPSSNQPTTLAEEAHEAQAPSDGPDSIAGLRTSVDSFHNGLGVPNQLLDDPVDTNYIRPCPPGMGADDMAFLQLKGALTIPSINLRNQLLCSYVQFVHPYLPILDLEDFLRPISSNNGSEQVSLMLFQAVMFAGAAFVDSHLLSNEGYGDRRNARKTLFQRVKLLYDFNYDLNRISMIQTLLLMTYWLENPNDHQEKEFFYWLGICLDVANVIGLHQSSVLSQLDSKTQRLRKRLWWACFMRDRLIALSVRKPLRIRDADYDTPMLVLDDFDINPPSTESVLLLGEHAMQDVQTQTTLAQLCIGKAKLCICVGHVLSTQYTAFGNRSGTKSDITMLLMPNILGTSSENIESVQCEQELHQWYNDLPGDCCFRSSASLQSAHHDQVLSVHRAVLSMVCSTTMSALHRSQILSDVPLQLMDKTLQKLSRHRVKEAAASIAEVSELLEAQNLVRFLPPVGVTVLIPSALVNLLEMRHDSADIRDIATRRFLHCIRAIHQLREIYPQADAAYFFLEAAFWKFFLNSKIISNLVLPRPGTLHDWLDENNMTLLVDAGSFELSQTTTSDDGSTVGTSRIDRVEPYADPEAPAFVRSGALPGLVKDSTTPEDGTFSNDDFESWIDFSKWSDLFMAEGGRGLELPAEWTADISPALHEVASTSNWQQ